jgi:hypothetical protein
MLFMQFRKPFLRLSQIGFAIAALAFIAPTMHATPITYNLTLTETDGNGTKYSGTGQVTLNVAGGIQNYVGYTTTTGLTAMSFVVDGQSFNITDATNQGNNVFGFSDVANGGVWDVTFSETNANGYRLVSTSGYIFYMPPNNTPVSPGWTGVFTASAAPPQGSVTSTPEPGSIALLGTGLLACAGDLRRRIRRR